MESNPIVSIILPVYNSIKYIRSAIESVIGQTYQNYELIIIDDESNDGTELICKEYAKEFNNIKYIRKKNGGVSSARNLGIDEARGEYISFLDHDDEYAPNYLKNLLDLIIKKKLDIVKCSVHYIDVSSNDKVMKEYDDIFDNYTCNREKIIKEFPSLSISYFDVWNGLYKAELINNNRIRFDENYIYGMEDYDFNTRIIPYVDRIGFCSDILYTHYMRMRQSTSGLFIEDHIYDIISYQNTSICVLEEFNNILSVGWKNALFGKNLIGIIKYCNRGNVKKDKTIEYLKIFTISNEYSIRKITFSLKYIKYILIAFFAKFGKYRILYYTWKIEHFFNV